MGFSIFETFEMEDEVSTGKQESLDVTDGIFGLES